MAHDIPSGKYHATGSGDAGRMSTKTMREFLPEQKSTERIMTIKSVAKENLKPSIKEQAGDGASDRP